MKKYSAALLIVVLIVALAEGLYITYPSWSALLSMFTSSNQTASSTPQDAEVVVAPKHIDEHAAYYDITTTYPGGTSLKVTAGATADAKAVAILKGFIENEIERFKENGNFANFTPEDIKMQGLDQGRKYILDVEYKTYSSAHTVSYVFTLMQDTLGAHPNTYYRTFTFSKATGGGLVLADVFSGDYLTTLSKLSRAKLPAIIANRESVKVSEIDTDMLSAGTTPDEDNFQTFYLDGKNFVLLFPPYQIGPYVLGVVTLPILLSDLLGILR